MNTKGAAIYESSPAFTVDADFFPRNFLRAGSAWFAAVQSSEDSPTSDVGEFITESTIML